jgi:hypothetical protein
MLSQIQTRIAWVEFARVSIAQVAEKIHLPLAVGKECRKRDRFYPYGGKTYGQVFREQE